MSTHGLTIHRSVRRALATLIMVALAAGTVAAGRSAFASQVQPVSAAAAAVPAPSFAPFQAGPEEPRDAVALEAEATAAPAETPSATPSPTAVPTETPVPTRAPAPGVVAAPTPQPTRGVPSPCPATWFCYPRLGVAGPIVPYADCSGSTDVGTAIRSFTCISDHYLLGHAYTQFGLIRGWAAGDAVFAYGIRFTVTGAVTEAACSAPSAPLAPLSMQTSLTSSACGPVLVVQAH